jgi:N-acetylmuramoyl-L-alanine amidase
MIRPSIKSMLQIMGIVFRPLTTLLFCVSVLSVREHAYAQAATPGATAAQPNAMLGKISPLAEVPDWQGLARSSSKVLTAKEFDDAYEGVFSDARSLPAPWQRNPESLDVVTGLVTPAVERIVFRDATEQPAKMPRYWKKASELDPVEGRPILSDLRIAIDPGHIGGPYGKMEERWLSFHADERIMEGESTLQASQALKKKLEAYGAQVFLIREKEEPVTTSRPADFRSLALSTLAEMGVQQPPEGYAGLEGPAKMMTIQWQSEKLFYRVSEIRERAKKVNDLLKPDVVLCLHLNAEPWGPANQPQFSPANHFHVLVNGAYMPDELQFQDIRFEMLQRIFSRVREEELPLAEEVAKGMAGVTHLEPYVYTQGAVRRVGTTPYVYARNLLANRLYRCPVIYLEPYVMNNQETYNRLLLGNYVGRTLINGRLRTSLIDDYAEGVAQGLVNYYRTKRRS